MSIKQAPRQNIQTMCDRCQVLSPQTRPSTRTCTTTNVHCILAIRFSDHVIRNACMHMSTHVRCAPLYTVSKLLVLGAGLMWQSIFPRLSDRDTAARACYIPNSPIFLTSPIAEPAPLLAHVRTWRNSSGQPVYFLVSLYGFERLGFLTDFSVASNSISRQPIDMCLSLTHGIWPWYFHAQYLCSR